MLKKNICHIFHYCYVKKVNLCLFLNKLINNLNTEMGRIYFGGHQKSDIVIINAHDP